MPQRLERPDATAPAIRVLPVDRCSRRLVSRLRGAGLAVEYREFDGGHAMPAPVVGEARTWLTAR